jgi:hypothetical protein
MTSPLPVGRSGLRSMLLRSRSRRVADRPDRRRRPHSRLRAFVHDSRHQVRGRHQGPRCSGVNSPAAAQPPRLVDLDQLRLNATDTSTWRPSSGWALRSTNLSLAMMQSPSHDGAERVPAPRGRPASSALFASVASADNCDRRPGIDRTSAVPAERPRAIIAGQSGIRIGASRATEHRLGVAIRARCRSTRLGAMSATTPPPGDDAEPPALPAALRSRGPSSS